jgi:hypothetical protein
MMHLNRNIPDGEDLNAFKEAIQMRHGAAQWYLEKLLATIIIITHISLYKKIYKRRRSMRQTSSSAMVQYKEPLIPPHRRLTDTLYLPES